ncbi:MAG TPA: hypothetical protein EYP68_06980 [Candidatus Korarchaeota archaeon]|nr:hypothetical protein [Candidatus Korarchaeota archaeon]
MRRAVIWTALALIGLILASFFLFLRPYFFEMNLKKEAQTIAEIVASEIAFMSRMKEGGALSGQRVVNIELEGDKVAEIMVYNGSVVVRLVAGTHSATANTSFFSSIPVKAPPKVYDGEVIFLLFYNETMGSYYVLVSNLVGRGSEG